MESTQQNKQWQVAEIQLSYKSNVKPSLRPKISSSRDAHEVLKRVWNDSVIELCEQFKVLFTNRANKVLGVFEVSTGGIAGTVADPKLIFVAALKAGATGLILSHYAK
jgi:DNA repair protein RadC